ncbi:hypothetical protein [Paenibacillus spongiae]|uniref:Uncharacterized protein n=1 Tax=Paenibacillus spongiae TaxID=2909671 RepID=A0ABY5S5L9_9BACL|nr:hypothetical protein [Paenibacillus spongiae]UVI28038.1 hypothetical protein L1F29_21595 [Paenibacillus spongiae]
MTTIQVRDRNEVLTLQFSELRNYHGNLAPMAIAVGFRVLQAAFQELYGNEAPDRKSLSIRSGHGGPGFRDAFEFVTRAVTRGAYAVDVDYPVAQYDPYRPQSYAYVISDDKGAAVEVALKENFLPAKFYDYLKKGREETMTSEEYEDNEQLKSILCDRALALPQDELLEVKRLS